MLLTMASEKEREYCALSTAFVIVIESVCGGRNARKSGGSLVHYRT
jgi:hypothetical protein